LIDLHLDPRPYGADAPRPSLTAPLCPISIHFAELPDGPQISTLNVLWVQKEGAQTRMSLCSQSFTFTHNMGWGLILCSTPPTQWTVW